MAIAFALQFEILKSPATATIGSSAKINVPVRPALVPVRPASAKPTQPGNLPVPQLAIHVIINVKFVLFTITAGNTAIRPRVGAKRARPIASGETGDPGKFF